MKKEAVFLFGPSDLIGTVAAVDTTRVSVSVSNASIVSYLSIANLVAIKGATEAEYLIGLIERVTRGLTQTFLDPKPDADEIPLQVTPADIVRIVLIGTFRSVDGTRTNVFKRGAVLLSANWSARHAIAGGNLQRFMGLLGEDFADEEKLRLGTFVADQSALAIASGDRLFQRHAAILGSTGSGKSWAVALILERASKLKFPNIIVFDLHGEYEPLSADPGGFRTEVQSCGSWRSSENEQ